MRRWLVVASLAVLAACAPVQPQLPERPVAAGPAVAVTAVATPFDPSDPNRNAVGRFSYAGGLVLSSSETARLHGLSDLDVTADGRLTAVSDEGDLFTARLRLTAQGRLAGMVEGRLSPLLDLTGRPIQDKAWGDAEGLAVLADGDRLVSFERNHRIWLYPQDGGAPRAVHSPDVLFPDNGGMEALAPAPDIAADAYIVGGEDSGQTWTCRLSAPCVEGPKVDKPLEFGLVALRALPGRRIAYLLRAWDPVRGSRITLTIQGPAGEIDRLDLSSPETVDNFEGLAAAPGPKGAIRFYLLSDDNFAARQRTLLLAFDWTPAA